MGERERGRRQRPDKAEPELAPPIVHEALSAPGQPLGDETRAFMEPRFGHDFSRVRVHTDTRAAESAEAVSALAYTVGQNIVFGAGQYQPGTSEGRRLIAHELAHTVQQGASRLRSPTEASALHIRPSGDTLEYEAQQVGDRAFATTTERAWTAPIVTSVADPGWVQRQSGEQAFGGPARRLFTGAQAWEVAANLLRSGQTATFQLQFGRYTFIPGTIITSPDGTEILFLTSYASMVVFAIENSVYEQDIVGFERSLLLNATREGFHRAEGMADLGKLEMDLIVIVFGGAPRVIASMVKAWVWATLHWATISRIARHASEMIVIHNEMKENFPVTYRCIWHQLLITAALDADFELSGSDVVKLLGALLRGSGVQGLNVVARSLWQIVRSVAKALTITTLRGAARGTGENMGARARELAGALMRAGVAVREQDMEQLVYELSQPRSLELLTRLQQFSYALAKDLENLTR